MRDRWAYVWLLHVEGFHDVRLRMEHIKSRIHYIEDLARLTKEGLARRKAQSYTSIDIRWISMENP